MKLSAPSHCLTVQLTGAAAGLSNSSAALAGEVLTWPGEVPSAGTSHPPRTGTVPEIHLFELATQKHDMPMSLQDPFQAKPSSIPQLKHMHRPTHF